MRIRPAEGETRSVALTYSVQPSQLVEERPEKIAEIEPIATSIPCLSMTSRESSALHAGRSTPATIE